ncbi:MAG: dienelactone hydrolase family protein [Gammaproteobacteria bacterium]
MKSKDIDPKVYELYDEYCHGYITRREFFRRAAKVAVGGMAAVAMANALLPRYAEAQTISFTDKRIHPTYLDYRSKRGSARKIRAYLAAPKGPGPFPAVLVIHENRGLNPHIEDVARRFAVEGFLALAPDALTAAGGYPGNDDDGRKMQRSLDRDKLKTDMVNAASFLKSHELSNNKLGVTGFCWGGSVTNHIAAQLGSDVKAAVPFYGSGVDDSAVANMDTKLMVQSAETDPRINKAWPDFEASLKKYGVEHKRHVYAGTQHGFHNNSTPRYNEEAADLAWQRTVAFFRDNLT